MLVKNAVKIGSHICLNIVFFRGEFVIAFASARKEVNIPSIGILLQYEL